MRTLLAALALLAVTARADAPPAEAQPNDAARGFVRESCRCAFVEPTDPWLLQAPWVVNRGFVRGDTLPAGWIAVADPVAPDPQDPAWELVTSAGMGICASAQLYDAPEGRVRAIVVAVQDEKRVPLFGVKLDKARGKQFAPVGTASKHVVMLTPPIASLSSAWSAALARAAGSADSMNAMNAMSAAAAKDDLAAFDAAAQDYARERPASARPSALRAGILIRKGETLAGRTAALAAIARSAHDPDVRAEALHWSFIAEYQLGKGPDVTLPITEQAVDAAKTSGRETSIVRAVYDRACARALAGDAAGAAADVREALSLETRMGRREYHAIALKEPDFAKLRGLPDFEAALKTP